MGNVFALCSVLGGSVMSKGDEKVVRVLKVDDGKILEFRAPVKVMDLLVNYPNSYVAIFREATQALPLEYNLKVGKIYYLLPCFPTLYDLKKGGGVRIKVVITKHQLRQLLSNQTKVEALLLGIIDKELKDMDGCLSSSSIRLQKLETIAEESE